MTQMQAPTPSSVGDDWERATRMAASILFTPTGLQTWPWYKASQARIEAEVGRAEMMHEATTEMFFHLRTGAELYEARAQTETYLRGLWRPRFSTQSASYEPPTLPLEEAVVANRTVRRDEVSGRHVRLLEQIREALTPREWELVNAAAVFGTMEAARVCGTHHSNVSRALRKARSVPLDTCSVYKGDGPSAEADAVQRALPLVGAEPSYVITI